MRFSNWCFKFIQKPAVVLGLVLSLGLAAACQTPAARPPARPSAAPASPTASPSAAAAVMQATAAVPRPTETLRSTEGAAAAPSGIAEADPARVRGLLEQVDLDRAMLDLLRLTGEEPICVEGGCRTLKNRLTGSDGLQLAKMYVWGELESLGYAASVQDWSFEGYSDQNLTARKPGAVIEDEEIYFIAHLDGVDSPAADDDASGAAALLELARVMAGQRFARTVVLLFTTGEEQGALGARGYVEQLTREQISAIRYAVNVEMIAYDSDGDGAMQLWSGDQPQDFVLLLKEVIETYQPGLTPQIVAGCG